MPKTRAAVNLTHRGVSGYKPADKPYEVRDAIVPGLRLIVWPSGVKTWCVRCSVAKRYRKITIPGRFDAIGVSDARDLARDIVVMVAKGRDPTVEKQRSGATVEHVVGRWLREHAKKNMRPSSRYQAERVLTNVTKAWGSRPLGDVTPSDVAALVRRVAEGAPHQASKILMYFSAICEWAMPDLLVTNPCRGLKKPAKEQARRRRLTDQELAWFWAFCEGEGWPYGSIGKLLVLTGQRPQEVAGLRRSELVGNTWLLPAAEAKNRAARTKNGMAHKVPLSKVAMKIIEDAPLIEGRDLIFSNTGSAHNLRDFLRRARTALNAAPWQLRDIRRTVVSNLKELGVPLEVREQAVNHSLRGLRAVYEQADLTNEVREAFDKWSTKVEQIVESAREAASKLEAAAIVVAYGEKKSLALSAE
jgi:integrase